MSLMPLASQRCKRFWSTPEWNSMTTASIAAESDARGKSLIAAMFNM
jgi:hypothetical protein